MIIGGVILISFLLGITFYNLGVAASLDRNLIQKLPPRYHSMVDANINLWQRPEEGFLSGSVESLDEYVLKLDESPLPDRSLKGPHPVQRHQHHNMRCC